MVYKSSVRYFHALHKFVHTYLLGFYFVEIFLLLSFLNLLKTNLCQIVHVEGEDGAFWVVKQRVLPEFEFWSAHLLIINKVSRELDQLAFPCFCLALKIFNLSSEGHEVDLHLLTEGRFFLLRIPLAFLNELFLHVLHFSVHTSRQVYSARDVFNILNTPSYEFLDELKFLNVFFKHWLKVFFVQELDNRIWFTFGIKACTVQEVSDNWKAAEVVNVFVVLLKDRRCDLGGIGRKDLALHETVASNASV